MSIGIREPILNEKMSETDPRARSSSAQRARPKPPTSRSSSASRGPSLASRRPSSIPRAPDDDSGPRSRSPPPSEPTSAIPENSEVGSEASLLSQGAARGLMRRRSSARMSVGESSRSPPPPNKRSDSPGLILEEPGSGDSGSRALANSRPGSPRSASTAASMSSSSLPGDGSSELEETINVGVRVRPIAPHEVKAGAAEAVRLDRSSGCISLHEPSRSGSSSSSCGGGGGGGGEDGDGDSSSGHNNARAGDGGGRDEFKFNFVYPSDVETFEVYDDLVNPILNHLFLGYNGTVLCYGQTGSGKTYTVSGTAHDPGIVPIAVNELFHLITERKSTEAFKVSLGYLEIYNERIYDLCSPTLNAQDPKDATSKNSSSGKDNSKDNGRLSKELPLYEDARLGTCVRGLTSQTVTSPEQVLHALALAQSSRSMAATAMNLNSSRSHTITRLVLEASAAGVAGATRVCMLNLVDLAGSERASKTKATGNTLREGAFINKSLLTLSTVIAELSKGKDRAGHVPYRDSKLTRLLQTSLGGNARTALVCNISPAGNQLVETRSTLMFGQRAATIVNKAVAGSIMDTATLLAAYQVELLKLKASHSLLETVVKLVADQEVTIEATSNDDDEGAAAAAATSSRPKLKSKNASGAAAASSSSSALALKGSSSSGSNSEPLVLRSLGILAAADENPAAAQALLRSLHGLALGAQAPALAWLCNQAAVLGQPPPVDAAAALAAYSASAAASSAVAASSVPNLSGSPINGQKSKSKLGNRPGSSSGDKNKKSESSGPALRGRRRAPGVGTVAASVFPTASPENEAGAPDDDVEGSEGEDEESEEEEDEGEETEAERSLRMLLGGSDEKGNRRRPPPPPKRQKSKRLAMSSKLMAEMQLLEEAAAAQTAAAAAAAASAESGPGAGGGSGGGQDNEDENGGGATLSDLGDAVALLEGGREALSRLLEVVGSLAGNANAEGLETEAEAAEAALDAAVMLLEEVSETAALENWGPQVSPDKAAGAVATSTSTSAVELDDGKMAELQARAEAAEARTKEFEAQLTQTKAKTEAALKERNEAVARAEAAEATLVKAEARAEVAEAHMHRAETRAEAAEAKITLSDANSETAADEHTARQKEMELLVAALQEIDAAALSRLSKKAVGKGAQASTIVEGEDEDDNDDGLGLGGKRGLGEETASEDEDEKDHIEDEEEDEDGDDHEEAHPWLDGSRVPGAASELQVKLLRRRSVVSPRKPPNLSSLMRRGSGAPSGPAAVAKRAVSRAHLLAARVEALEAAVTTAETSAKNAQSAYNAAMSSAPGKDLALADALSRAEAADASVEASKQALKASEAASEEALALQTSKVEVKMAESRAAAEKAVQESAALQSQMTFLQEAQKEQATHLATARDEVKTLTGALDKAKEELTASEALVASLREGHNRLFSELSAAEEEVKQARADATAAVEATAAAEAARVASAHQSASAQVADAVAATAKANSDLDAARKQMAHLESEAVAKDKQLQDASEEAQAKKQLEEQLRAQKDLHQELEKQLQVSTAEVDNVRSQLETTQAAAEAAAAQHEKEVKEAESRVKEAAAAAEISASEKTAAAEAERATAVAAAASEAAATAEQKALSVATAAEGEALLQEVEVALAAAVSVGHEASQAVSALSTVFEASDADDNIASAASASSSGPSKPGADINAPSSTTVSVSTVASEVRLAYAQRLTNVQSAVAQSRSECRRLSSLLEAALSQREDAAALHASETRRASLEAAADEAMALTKEAEVLMVKRVEKAGEVAAAALHGHSDSNSGTTKSNVESGELDLDEIGEESAATTSKQDTAEKSRPNEKKRKEELQQLEACVDLSRECLYFKRKADLSLALRNDAQRGLQLARRQLQTLQDYADAEHVSALALDAAPDLAAATQQLLTKLQSQSEQLDARNNELETLKVVQAASARDLENLSLDVEGLELSLRECERSRNASDDLVQQLQQRCAALTAECASLASEARQSALRAAAAQDGKDKAERVIVAAGLSYDAAAGSQLSHASSSGGSTSSNSSTSTSTSSAEELKKAHARQDAAQLEAQQAQQQLAEARAQYQATHALASQVSESLAAARTQYQWVTRALGPQPNGNNDGEGSASEGSNGNGVASSSDASETSNSSSSGLLVQQEKLEQSVKLLAAHLRHLSSPLASSNDVKRIDTSKSDNSNNANGDSSCATTSTSDSSSADGGSNSVAEALAHARELAASERESAIHRSHAEAISNSSSSNGGGEERGRDSRTKSTTSKSKSPPALPARSRSRK